MTKSRPCVRVEPSMRFGRPHMNGISTEVIADSHWVGDDPEVDYGLTRHELLVALWFEAAHGQRRFRRRWRVWLAGVNAELWRGNTGVELPPTDPARG